MSTKKIICLILTFLLLLVCVASCQAANAGITTQEQAADRQSSDAPAETVSYGKDSSDRTEAEASHTKKLLLNSGHTMPILGLGTYVLDHDTCVNSVKALVQNEIHPYYQEQDVVPFIQEKGIVVQCWYPLGGRGHTAELLGDETIRNTSKKIWICSVFRLRMRK